MISQNSANLAPANTNLVNPVKLRRASYGSEAQVLTDIYLEDTNIVIWQRQLSPSLKSSVEAFLQANTNFQSSLTVTSDTALSSVSQSLGENAPYELSENIAFLVDMFCSSFELKRVGLRLTVLDRAMCPKFHVDNVPCRLITTFQGVATEWLPHESVNREKLGVGSQGKPDHESGLYQNQGDIQQLNCGDVALLKGEMWQGNEKAGLVHRSPQLPHDHLRLLLTLDFIND